MVTTPKQSSQPFVGKELSKRTFTLSEAIVGDYYKGLHLEPDTNETIPSSLASEPDNGYFAEIAFPYHIGHLWMRQQWELFGPLIAGQSYEVGGRITDIYQRRDRSVVCYQVDLTDSSGQCLLLTHHHQSFLTERVETAQVEFRDPAKKPGARKFDVPKGEAFGGLSRVITPQMCGDYFHGDANYHTDQNASEALGFKDIVVGGRMTMAYAATILEERFGDAWWQSGRFDLKFTNPVWTNDTVTAHGVVTGPDPEDSERTHAFVWLAKPDDTIVLIANASVQV